MVQPSTAPLVASTLAPHRFLFGCTRFSSNRATVSGANSSLGHGAGGRGWPHGGQGGGPVQRGVPPGLQGQRARRHGRESPQRYACSRLARVVRWEGKNSSPCFFHSWEAERSGNRSACLSTVSPSSRSASFRRLENVYIRRRFTLASVLHSVVQCGMPYFQGCFPL